jgi:putative transposase
MDEYESLSHTKWECKYHVIFIPKFRRKVLYGRLRQYLGEVFRTLAAQKESRIEEGHLLADHVHMMIAISPKFAVSQVIGFIKGKSDRRRDSCARRTVPFQPTMCKPRSMPNTR